MRQQKPSRSDRFWKWAAIVITCIAYPVVLYELWMLFH